MSIFKKAQSKSEHDRTSHRGLKDNNGLLSAGIGLGAGAGAYGAIYPWEAHGLDLKKYPRLGHLRKAGSQHGFKMVGRAFGSFETSFKDLSSTEKVDRIKSMAMYGELDPSGSMQKLREKGYQGVVYIQGGAYRGSDLPRNARFANLGNWDIGADKLDTWEYFKKQNIEHMHAKSIGATEFYDMQKGKAKGLSTAGREFIHEAGGLENIIVKMRSGELAARGQGVWMDASKLSGEVAEKMLSSPQEFLLQQKEQLAEEYRVVTAGDKAVSTTYRFGSPRVRALAEKMGYTPIKDLAGAAKTARVSPFEIIQPVFNKTEKQGLESFAEQVSRHMPYEIGAFDIGKTKGGKYVVIEAQRSFGNISNPITSRRIKQLVTGKAGPGALAMAGAVGLAAAGLVNHFTGKDDGANTIEALRHEGIAGDLRHKNTDFGSGYRGPKISNNWIDHFMYQASLRDRYGMKTYAGRPQSQESLIPSKYIRKMKNVNAMHQAAAEGVLHVPEYYFLGSEDFGSALSKGDLAWQNFLDSNQAVTKSTVIRSTAKSPTVSPFNRGTVGKYLVAGAAAAWLLSRFSGQDDEYNTIEGMKHLGLAAKQRKILTDFGSGFDKVRQLAKQMGKTFEEVVSSRGFQEALGQAKQVRKLGAGKFAEAHLMEAQYGGEALQFVRKRVTMTEQQLRREAAHPEKYLRSLDLRHEAEMMSVMGEGKTVPSVYTSKTKEMFMEHMPGKNLAELYSSGGQLSKQARADLYESIEEAAIKGRVNLDIHHGNILYDPSTQRVSWIDWGQAQLSGEGSGATIRSMEERAARYLTPVSAPRSSVTTALKKRTVATSATTATPIEGMSGKGIAHRKRKTNTPFGSSSTFRSIGRWFGKLFGQSGKKAAQVDISQYFGRVANESMPKLMDPRRAARLSEQAGTVEEFAKKLGIADDVIVARNIADRKKIFERYGRLGLTPELHAEKGGSYFMRYKTGGEIKSAIIMDIESTKQAMMQHLPQMPGVSKQVAERALKSEEFYKATLYHELLETQAAARFSGQFLMPKEGHAAAQVLIGEGGFLHHVKDSNVKKMLVGLRKRNPLEHTMQQAGFDAFQEGGEAAINRHLITDFGSAYRGLLKSTSKKIATSMRNNGKARRALIHSSKDLKKAQHEIWSNATYGGKGHTRRGRNHVKQLSKFGGGI